MTDPAIQTMPVGIALFQGEYTVPWGEIAAASFITHGAAGPFGPGIPAADRDRDFRGRHQGVNLWQPSTSGA